METSIVAVPVLEMDSAWTRASLAGPFARLDDAGAASLGSVTSGSKRPTSSPQQTPQQQPELRCVSAAMYSILATHFVGPLRGCPGGKRVWSMSIALFAVS